MSISPRCLRAAAMSSCTPCSVAASPGTAYPPAGGHRRRGPGVQVVDHHPRARRGQPEGQRPADPRAAAGHDNPGSPDCLALACIDRHVRRLSRLPLSLPEGLLPEGLRPEGLRHEVLRVPG